MVKFYDYFEDNRHCFLVEELCTKGDLETFVVSKPRKRLDEPLAVIFFK